MNLFDSYRERSTLRTMNAPALPSITKGSEKYLFKVGQKVQASGKGMYRQGTAIMITSRYKENGYCYYVDDNKQVHRTKDIM